jgi:hypothetical protein
MTLLPVCLVALAAAIGPTSAPEPAEQRPDPAKPTVITVRPAAAPVPALRYQLMPERRDFVAGNAAVFYHRATELLLNRRQENQPDAQPAAHGQPRPRSIEQEIADWVTVPSGEVPLDQARRRLDDFKNVLHEVELGAWRQSCDWQYDHRDEGFNLLIPEVQEMRSLCRVVALSARVAALEGKTDEAVHWLQTGFAMARHVSQGPIVLQALVGTAMTGQMARAVEDLIQAPGTPSLYWALTACPQPFIDMNGAVEAERTIVEQMVPALRTVNDAPWSTAQAQQIVNDLLIKIAPAFGDSGVIAGQVRPGSKRPSLKELPTRLGLTAIVAKVYPEARRALIAEGRPASEVDSMPAVQVALAYTFMAYKVWRDDEFKWSRLPYAVSYKHAFESGHRRAPMLSANPLLTMLQSLEPAIMSARFAELRTDRHLDALRCIEAVRLYAAGHGGKLPPSLDAITEAPAPNDPATGKPFEYRLDGDTATLSGPVPPGGPDHPMYAVRYDLKLAR